VNEVKLETLLRFFSCLVNIGSSSFSQIVAVVEIILLFSSLRLSNSNKEKSIAGYGLFLFHVRNRKNLNSIYIFYLICNIYNITN